ncbi:MAG: SurA N-terminal domain-containing protein [Kibdelosporangium sp.]
MTKSMLDPASRSAAAIGRPAKFVAVLTAAAALVAGCGSGPGQVNTAAIIDGRTISVDDVQSRVEKVLRDNKFVQQLQQQRKLDLLSRSILTREVSYELLAKAAEREQLAVDEDQVNKLVAERGGQGQPPAEAMEANLLQATDAAFDPREVARNEVIAAELASNYLSRLGVTFTGAVLTGTDAKRDAQDMGKKLAADPADAQKIVGEVEQGIPSFKMNLVNGVLIAQQVGFELATSPLMSTLQNNVVVFSLAPHMVQDTGGANSWFVALVNQRNLNDSLTDQEKQAVESVPPALLTKMGQRLASQYIGEIKLEISPRYGVWDQVGNAVAPRAEEVAGYVYPARAAKP